MTSVSFVKLDLGLVKVLWKTGSCLCSRSLHFITMMLTKGKARHYTTVLGGIHGVMVNVIRNGDGDMSSNSG